MAAKFDLTLAFRQDRDPGGAPAGISAFLEYAGDLFDHATIQALAARLTRLLGQAAASPPAPSAPSTCSPTPSTRCWRGGMTRRGWYRG